MNIPTDLKYTKEHEWVKVDGNTATIGITDNAQSALSDIVYVEITVEVGDEAKKDSVGATIESVKAAADINIPISGKVVEINESVADSPEIMNSDPFGEAWMIKIEMGDSGELESLMDAAEYKIFTEERGH